MMEFEQNPFSIRLPLGTRAFFKAKGEPIANAFRRFLEKEIFDPSNGKYLIKTELLDQVEVDLHRQQEEIQRRIAEVESLKNMGDPEREKTRLFRISLLALPADTKQLLIQKAKSAQVAVDDEIFEQRADYLRKEIQKLLPEIDLPEDSYILVGIIAGMDLPEKEPEKVGAEV